MTTRHQMQDEIALENIALEGSILPATMIQRMSQWELEAELVSHIDHEKSIHIVANIERRSSRVVKSRIGRITPQYQPGYRRGQLNARQKPWVL